MDESIREREWEALQTQQSALFHNAIKENDQLRLRIRELEQEVSVYKVAYATVDDRAASLEREALQLKQSIHSLKTVGLAGRLLLVHDTQQDNPIILTLIDGDGNIFSSDFLMQGNAGGRQAAMLLNQGITDYAAQVDQTLANRGCLWLSIFCNKMGLAETLTSHGYCSADQFQEFCTGFNQSSPFFSLIDCGPGKEAADGKIKEFLRVFTQLPQTAMVVFGGSHDNGYTSTLSSLENLGLLGKLVLLQGYDELAVEIKSLKLPVLQLDRIFMTRKIINSTLKRQPQSSTAMTSSTSQLHTAAETGKLLIDPNLPINKQQPPPCTFHYLDQCPKGSRCRFGHDYILTKQNWADLRAYAKKWPCSEILKGNTCPLGENCYSSHYCPQGARCNFFKQGRCKFAKDFMHLKEIPYRETERGKSIDTDSSSSNYLV